MLFESDCELYCEWTKILQTVNSLAGIGWDAPIVHSPSRILIVDGFDLENLFLFFFKFLYFLSCLHIAVDFVSDSKHMHVIN